jgi:hypothetical protein
MTGFEYTAAVLMMNWGMVDEGLECVRNIRNRYDGEKRNPWDEAECGHHYARAMAAWSAVLTLSGFSYDGASASVVAVPPDAKDYFNSFWSTGTGWGTYSLRHHAGGTSIAVKVLAGTLACRSCEIAASGKAASVESGGGVVENHVSNRGERIVVSFGKTLHLMAKDEVRIEVRG